MYQKAGLRSAEYSDRAQAGAHVLITNDGNTIAKGIVLGDPVENMGAQLLKEAALQTNTGAGDGTTTAIVLAQSILHEAFRNVAAGADPLALRRGLQIAAEVVVKDLSQQTRPIVDQETIAQVASVSCQDDELGSMMVPPSQRLGWMGLSLWRKASGWRLPWILGRVSFLTEVLPSLKWATDQAQTVAELHCPYILLCDAKITNPQDLIPVLTCAAEDGRSCLIISEGVEGDALGLVLANKTEGDIDIVCIEAPLYGDGRRWRMEDLAVQTGGSYITKDLGLDIRQVTREMLGTAQYARVTRSQTIITGAGGDPVLVEERIKELRHLVANTDYKFNRERYQERLAPFVSGVARIAVGGRRNRSSGSGRCG